MPSIENSIMSKLQAVIRDRDKAHTTYLGLLSDVDTLIRDHQSRMRSALVQSLDGWNRALGYAQVNAQRLRHLADTNDERAAADHALRQIASMVEHLTDEVEAYRDNEPIPHTVCLAAEYMMYAPGPKTTADADFLIATLDIQSQEMVRGMPCTFSVTEWHIAYEGDEEMSVRWSVRLRPVVEGAKPGAGEPHDALIDGSPYGYVDKQSAIDAVQALAAYQESRNW